MLINNISIRNFKGISHLELNLGTKMNVIMGENGVGKSTTLLALSKCLSWYLARVVNLENGRGNSIVDNEVKHHSAESDIQITVNDEYSWNINKTKSRKGIISKRKSNLSAIKEYIINNIHFDNDNIPVIVYYGVNRSVQDIPLRLHKNKTISPFNAYHNALSAGANFRNFFEWLREREDIENQHKIDTQNLSYSDIQISAVRTAISQALPQFSNLKINRNPRAITIEKNGVKYNVEQFSDGEKCFITLIGDIARRIAIATPNSNNPLIDGKGIIMIDEVDLHFHPKWQADIISSLKKIFPNCQFIVSTHSPFVISSIKNNDNDKLFVLNDGELKNFSINSYGKDVNNLLQYYFNVDTVRNNEVQKIIDDLDTLLQTNNAQSTQYDEKLNQLKSILNTDPIVLRYQTEKLIRKKNEKNQ